MKEETIGIIIQKYDGMILFDYIIGKMGKEDENIDDTIKREIKEKLNSSLYRKIKKYDEKLKYKDKEIDMYLVEIVGYDPQIDEKFKFVERSKILDELYESNYKDFLRKNIIKYEEYNCSIRLLLNVVIILFMSIALAIVNKVLNFDLLLIDLAIVALTFIVLRKYVNPKLIKYLIKFDINPKVLDLIVAIIIILCISKLII
ncbi:hypothetical protein [Clostridium sp. CCUG 7971]|uniref:hypothetical protein n=1 Tax=Clostridium sp. CCUG 7971 TaxID=2811414 RepID=UPI001ABB7013|nr:hypothetical protein [Clostridium sp. CCUG 7971]MBO3443941.1 hypothetical protein [Clostridium sp. CCUG 7971]